MPATVATEPVALAEPAVQHFDVLLERLRESTGRLLQSLAGLADAAAAGPSSLPGWSRGHVVTHLARNADGNCNLVHWAATGDETPKYASQAARAAGIEEGASRPAAELVADLTAACSRLDDALAALAPDRREATIGIGPDGTGPAWLILPWRMQEVEVHHVDLDLAYTPAHWPLDFAVWNLTQVTREMSDAEQAIGSLRGHRTGRTWRLAGSGPELSGPENALLAWLIGRSDGDGLLLDGGAPTSPLPRPPDWV